jgi:hypothetical protein
MAVNIEDLGLLADPNQRFDDEEAQRDAHIAAFMVGCELVESRSSTRSVRGGWPALDKILSESWMTQPQPREYIEFIVRPAVQAGVVDATVLQSWDRVLEEGDKLDERVQWFMEGWQVRGKEILDIQRRMGRRQ